jgi:hypothetical protein
MNEINTIDNEQQTTPAELNHLFAQLAPQDVEQFYQSYRLWSLQHDIATVQSQISELQQQIEHNAQLMQSFQPSPIALSVLAQLQAYGVSDLDLLDRMLERGDSWLDHTVQLLVRCEELGVIRSDYTQWCENALEGAYDWITSMDQATTTPEASEPFDQTVESALLHKLMSEDDTEPRLPIVKADSIDIAEQAILHPANNAEYIPPETSTGTTEAINLEDLKVPVTTHEEDSDANPSSMISDQSTDEIRQMDVFSDLYHTTTETTESVTIKQRMDTIYSFRNSPTNISHNKDIFAESPITINNSTVKETSPTANRIDHATQQEDDNEEQTAIIATNTVTAQTVKNSEKPAEQSEQTTDHTTTKVHLQEDDLALPPVTNTYSISWSDMPTVTNQTQHSRQPLQTTITPHEPTISSESIELSQPSSKKRRSLLERLFRYRLNR